MTPKRFDVYLVTLDPAQGAELNSIRPCAIVSPDKANFRLRTVIVAPLTRPWPLPQGQALEIATHQLRAVDKSRLIRKVGTIQAADRARVTAALTEFFA